MRPVISGNFAGGPLTYSGIRDRSTLVMQATLVNLLVMLTADRDQVIYFLRVRAVLVDMVDMQILPTTHTARGNLTLMTSALEYILPHSGGNMLSLDCVLVFFVPPCHTGQGT